MIYYGRVVKGVVVLDEPVQLPEGAAVTVTLVEPQVTTEKPRAAARPIEEEIAEICKDVPESEWAKLPEDLTDQLDHYIYGTPKK